MSFWERLGEIFAPRITITKTYTVREMTDAESEAFDAAFSAMDAAFTKMDEAFEEVGRAKA